VFGKDFQGYLIQLTYLMFPNHGKEEQHSQVLDKYHLSGNPAGPGSQSPTGDLPDIPYPNGVR